MGAGVYEEFESWLERVNRLNPPPEGVVAYNFGLFESENGYKIYLVGASRYDPADDDWACNEDYVPEEKYFSLPEYFTEGKGWQEVQGEVIRLVTHFIESRSAASSFLTGSSAVTVGFDDGGLERVK